MKMGAANKYRKDKKSDCRRNGLESRIFVGRVFGDYAECLHFYPRFAYGRIIAGDSDDHVDFFAKLREFEGKIFNNALKADDPGAKIQSEEWLPQAAFLWDRG